MTLSVLMSVYHRETGKNLEMALDSIWDKQSHKPNQIVLVQDGPLTDELYAVIGKYKTICGEAFCSPVLRKNSGLVDALNTGLEYVTSEFVARMDSDDISAPDRFEKQLRFLAEHPDVDVLGGSLQEFNDEDECISIRRYPKDNIKQYIAKASPLAHPSVIMRMRIFKDGGLRYDKNYPLNEDIALWYDIVRKGYKISNLDDIIYYLRSDGGMIKRRSRVKAKTEFYAYMRGIKNLYGICSWRYIYPITRYFFRLLPPSLIGIIYGSKIRTKFLKAKE